MKKESWVIVLTCAGLAAVFSVGSVQATPAFARREGVLCQTCHFRMPELNAFGKAYAMRGFRLAASAEKSSSSESRPLGAPASLQLGDYVSIVGHHGFTAEKGTKSTFDAGSIDFPLGGRLDQRWSVFAHPSLDVENGGSDVEQAYGQFFSPFGGVSGSLRAGQISPFAILLNQGDFSLALSAPVALEATADTGNTWSPTTLLRGVETGVSDSKRWNAYLGVGQPHLEEEPAERHTDIYASGEAPVGSNGSISTYGYWGQASLDPSVAQRSFHRFGILGNAYFAKTKAVAGFLTGKDKTIDDASLDSSGWFLLGEHLLNSKWSVYARYDKFDRDLEAGGSESVRGPTLGVSWWMSTETRLTLEGQFLKTTGSPTDRLFTAEFLWAF